MPPRPAGPSCSAAGPAEASVARRGAGSRPPGTSAIWPWPASRTRGSTAPGCGRPAGSSRPTSELVGSIAVAAGLSARGVGRLLRVARTIADLDGRRRSSATSTSRRRPGSGSRAARTPVGWRAERRDRGARRLGGPRVRPGLGPSTFGLLLREHGQRPRVLELATSTPTGRRLIRDGPRGGSRLGWPGRWSRRSARRPPDPAAILDRLAADRRRRADARRSGLSGPASPDRGAATGPVRARGDRRRSTRAARSRSSGPAGRPRPAGGSPPGSPTPSPGLDGDGRCPGWPSGSTARPTRRPSPPAGPTVAVLGSGHDRLFPAAHRRLADGDRRHRRRDRLRAAAGRRSRRQGTFPRRNRVISGLADATVVVEAGAGQRGADHRPLGPRAGPRLLPRAGLDRRAGLGRLPGVPARVPGRGADRGRDRRARSTTSSSSGPEPTPATAPGRTDRSREPRSSPRSGDPRPRSPVRWPTARRPSTSSPTGPACPSRPSSGR